MKLLEKIFGKKEPVAKAAPKESAKAAPQEFQPHKNDMCCGGCGGHGHGRKKDEHENT